MTIEYSVCGEVGGGLTTTGINSVSVVSSGASGTLATIPSGATGEKIRLSLLVSIGAGNESGITVNSGGSPIISGGNLDQIGDAPIAGVFRISPEGYYAFIDVEKNQNITIVKDAGSTTNDIAYAYQYIR